jgi:gamma-glutamyltranspeptidase / glutathione hydrolase
MKRPALLLSAFALLAAPIGTIAAQTITVDAADLDEQEAVIVQEDSGNPAQRRPLSERIGAVPPAEQMPVDAGSAAELADTLLKYGVVSTAHPDATNAGMRILQQGGNATDAALAVMLALTVVEPQSSGIGGGGFFVYNDGASGAISTIDGREMAPSAANAARFLGADGNPLPFRQAFPGGMSVGVPGNIALMAEAHGKWGKLPWAELFTPAIQLADGGFEVNAALAERLVQIAPLWADFPDAKAIYWVDGAPAKAGDEINNPALARTLERVAELGPDAFYAGETGQEIVRKVTTARVNPGDMSTTDLTAYAAKERPPVCMAYRVYKICGMGPPSSGGVTVMQILGQLERFDMAALGPDNPQSWHLLGQSMQLAYADRGTYLGDPDFVEVPVLGLIDPEYLAERSALIKPDVARTDYPAGTPKNAAPWRFAEPEVEEGTTHFTVVDAAGNVVSMTSTIEGPFGSQLIAGGFFLNNELTDFAFAPNDADGAMVANAVAGGKRPLSSMSPTIVYNADGKPILALGSAGGKRIIVHVAKTLVGVLDFGLPLDQAIALPNIYFGNGSLLIEKGSALEGMQEPLSAYGQAVVATDLPSKVNGAQWFGTTGWMGYADPRSLGNAARE